ncbi:MAG: Lrp/AsnC ligand binding domain-containing protein, partial [Pseudomonadota bacterium]
KVTGDDCFIARLAVPSIEQLDDILDVIADKAETSTSIVKSQPIRRRPPPLVAG